VYESEGDYILVVDLGQTQPEITGETKDLIAITSIDRKGLDDHTIEVE